MAAKRFADAEREARTAKILKALDEKGPDCGFGWSREHEDIFMRDFRAREAEGDRLWAALSPEQKAKKKRMAGIACGFIV